MHIPTQQYPAQAANSSKGSNPKHATGSNKVSITSVPPIAILHEACALMSGTWKYGVYNWREEPVQARIYLDACFRHLYAWMEGEEYAEDSGVHHLGHARACLAILLDAMEHDRLVDDRQVLSPATFSDLMNDMNYWVRSNTPEPEPVDAIPSDALQELRDHIATSTGRFNDVQQNYKRTDITPGG